MLIALFVIVQVVVIVHVLMRPHRDPASRVAWIVVVLVLPIIGLLAYILLGNTNIGPRRAKRMRAIQESLPDPAAADGYTASEPGDQIPERYRPLFRVGESISGYLPIGGNRGQLFDDSNKSIDALIADIDAAKNHVHILFYIWLTDTNGTKVAEALMRAVARGVQCRVLVDALGSRGLIRSPIWQRMNDAGVKLGRALKISHPFLRMIRSRIDLRNHRKIVVIDNSITYVGSQNCADPEFRVESKYAPWVDIFMRFEGPVARQNQHLFAIDWMTYGGDDIADLLREPTHPTDQALPSQVIASGPTVRHSAVPEMFLSLMYEARRELVITTPYYVPNAPIDQAIRGAARRGVDTSLVVPARNNKWTVAATCQSYYEELLIDGVQIYEYVGGLLHAKSLTMDGEVTLIGSANMDRRSFELNFENNILFYDPDATGAMRTVQDAYIAKSTPVRREEVEAWPARRRLWNNAVATLSPLL